MKKTMYNEKTVGELKASSTEARTDLLNLRVEKEQRKTKNLHSISNKKKDLARILTALNNKGSSK
jgi:ribosomal protein L29